MINYFNFFNLPPSPTVDKAALKKTFYANSKKFHPDFHTLADDATRDDALEQSTINNQGYKILSDEDRTLKHLLDIKGVLGEEGSNKMPQSFLMEIMEVNEALMELEFDDDPGARARIDSMVNELEAGFRAEVGDLLENYDDATTNEGELQRLKDYYLKKRYLLRLKNRNPEV
ncbi:iron-sulfur cluster co-chaperone HscB C-terminal domain-containing protein [Neolewinella persica]|uniref:iron-sulfur cluster co-chaperone HscB C-terminal domain-containing protein n=1 Tax=Neolewinella persica TaxID=70998 RepID=UPI00036048EA|nr:iron-sulfur cluster co-chaperone HscB C-terminal domain-containing protein [Neolewinella persica]